MTFFQRFFDIFSSTWGPRLRRARGHRERLLDERHRRLGPARCGGPEGNGRVEVMYNQRFKRLKISNV